MKIKQIIRYILNPPPKKKYYKWINFLNRLNRYHIIDLINIILSVTYLSNNNQSRFLHKKRRWAYLVWRNNLPVGWRFKTILFKVTD